MDYRRWGQSIDDRGTAVPSPMEPPTDKQADKQGQIIILNPFLELHLTLPQTACA